MLRIYRKGINTNINTFDLQVAIICFLQENQYIDAIKTVGSTLAHYDLTQEIAAYGFGAKFAKRRKQKINNCFPLTLNSENVFTKGIKVRTCFIFSSVLTT